MQFQCDAGASPIPGFGIDCNGTITFNGSDQGFFECETHDNGENIYHNPHEVDQQVCHEIILTVTKCAPPCPFAPPPPPPPTPPPQPPSTCPTNLKGEFQFPHLIVPVDSTKPDQALGMSYNGVIVANEDSLFLFDIPPSYSGKTCSVVFLLPMKKDLQTSSYDLMGSGAIDFAQLEKNINQGTTWNNKGPLAKDFGVTTVAPGSASVIATFSCPAGKQVSYQLSSSGGTSLKYFQDYNPAP